ncbi:MAG: mannose-1-phosphate guanylyltransferase [Saprospiraceae bacterium]
MLGKEYYAVIMAGGIGSRFWPYSRNNNPKQFLDILGTNKSLLQMTYDRLAGLFDLDNILIVSHMDYIDLVYKQLPNFPLKNLISEPSRKNTAPCIAAATQTILKRNSEAFILTAPADHLILQENQFRKDLIEGFEFLETGDFLLTLGIEASRADTGYGYIHFKEDLNRGKSIYPVESFVEKPDHNTALKYIASGDYVWNSGMFLWKASTIWSAFEKYTPEIASLFSNFELAKIEQIYEQSTSISIDYAIMEKADNTYVKRVDFGWSDLGTWGSIYNLLPQDENSNASNSNNELLYNVEDCIIHNDSEQIMVLQGLKDYIVVNTKDALLICKKSEEQNIKLMLTDVEKKFGKKNI